MSENDRNIHIETLTKKHHNMLLRFIKSKALMNIMSETRSNSDHWKNCFRMNGVIDSIPLPVTQCHILRTCLDRILMDIVGDCRQRGLHESGRLCDYVGLISIKI